MKKLFDLYTICGIVPFKNKLLAITAKGQTEVLAKYKQNQIQ